MLSVIEWLQQAFCLMVCADQQAEQLSRSRQQRQLFRRQQAPAQTAGATPALQLDAAKSFALSGPTPATQPPAMPLQRTGTPAATAGGGTDVGGGNIGGAGDGGGGGGALADLGHFWSADVGRLAAEYLPAPVQVARDSLERQIRTAVRPLLVRTALHRT